MDQRSGDLAGLLLELKQRSGLSYADLARRTYTSRSTLHRYCSGHGTPPDYQLVARIAQECDASDDELTTLLRHWRGRTHQPPDTTPPPVSVMPGRTGRTDLVAAVLAVLTVLTLLVATASAPGQPAPTSWETVSLAAPSWVATPAPVPPAMFGVTMNSTSGAMPTFQVGSVRFWDSRTRWANVQPRRDRFNWTTVDRLVNGARQSNLSTPTAHAPHRQPTSTTGTTSYAH